MLASVLIIGISTILFLYWFRYTCALILSTKTAKDYTRQVAATNQLCFLAVQEALADQPLNLEPLRESLDQDYKVVTYLNRNTGEADTLVLEQWMLKADFHLMRGWYSVVRSVSEGQARGALGEMAQIVGHFANAFGERTATASASAASA